VGIQEVYRLNTGSIRAVHWQNTDSIQAVGRPNTGNIQGIYRQNEAVVFNESSPVGRMSVVGRATVGAGPQKLAVMSF
jgi:hypothetical protein